MIEIKLSKSAWYYNPERQLGRSGGFGAVFEGRDTDGNPVAIKQLHISASEAAHRELRMADSLMQRDLQHVLPVLDAGQDAESDRYFLVMPIAECSLQDILDKRNSLDTMEAIEVLLAVAKGLDEVTDITHRDLKPGNILYHNDHWKVADFGIARFVEESTSARTLKGAMTLAYAAPEQLRLERSTQATDVYALGCIAFQLLTGSPPFVGSREELRDAHQHQSPPSVLAEFPGHLRTLISMMLRKAPGSRPSISRVTLQLEQMHSQSLQNSSPALDALAQAGARIAEESARSDAEVAQAYSARQERAELLYSGWLALEEVIERLKHATITVAPNTVVESYPRQLLGLKLGRASMTMGKLDVSQPIAPDAFPQSKWDVVGAAMITLHQAASDPRYEYEWSSNLWYRRWSQHGDYRWVEVDYRDNAWLSTQHRFQPYAISSIEDADIAASSMMHSVDHASKPRPIDDENIEDFIAQWVTRLSDAAEGKLQRPETPYDPTWT